MYIIQIFLSCIAKIILFLMGWKYIKQKQITKFNKFDRSVIIFSHTTYADFYIFILYFFAYPKDFKNLKVLVKPQPFEYAGFILRRLNCIPSANFNERNSGSTVRIVEELDKYKEFMFLISPKGTIVNSKWRSGYYNIAVNLKAHLQVTGLDYEKKKIKISDGIKYDQNKDDIDNFLKTELSKIVPLFPEDEIVKIREHDENLRSIMNLKRLIFIILFLIWLIY